MALRWKHVTVQAAANAGLRVPLQTMAASWSDAKTFLAATLGLPSSSTEVHPSAPLAILKPTRGAASMDVFAATDLQEAEASFRAIWNSPSHGGSDENDGSNSKVLVQEYLTGDEFAVDTVSLNGEHKVLAVWKYDKRAVNGQRAPVVYFSTILQPLFPPDEEHTTENGEMAANYVVDYAIDVLNAVGLRDGPAHTEVKYDSQSNLGPVIVEVNARWHATNFRPLCDTCQGLGRNALDATVHALVASKRRGESTAGTGLSHELMEAALGCWNELPQRYGKLKKYGRIVHVVCYVTGKSCC